MLRIMLTNNTFAITAMLSEHVKHSELHDDIAHCDILQTIIMYNNSSPLYPIQRQINCAAAQSLHFVKGHIASVARPHL